MTAAKRHCPVDQVSVRSNASAEAAAMQIARVVTLVALLTTTVTLADKDPSKTLRTPAMPKMLYVMEYDCMFDWEPVKLEEGVTNVVAWMMQLQDRLTLTPQTPRGDELMIPRQWWVPAVAEPARREDNNTRREISLKEIIQIQLEANTDTVWLPKYLLVVYQISMVPGGPTPDALFVTTAKTFWQVVEASAAANKFVTRSNLNFNLSESAVELAPLCGFVVAFPTMNAIHGQDSWGAEYVSEEYADHSAWDVHTIIDMLHTFFAVSGTISLPDLAEYEWRLDKLIMHDVFQRHYHQDPSNRFSHIPSIPISIPVDYPTQLDFCYTARYLKQQQQTVPEEDVHATAAALLHAVQELELDRDAHSIQETNQESDGRPVRKYFIKRNYSAGAKNVFTFTLRSSSNWQPSMPSRHSAQHPSSCSESTPSKPAATNVVELDNHPNASNCCAKDACRCDRVVPTVTGTRVDSSGTERVDLDVSPQGIAKGEAAADSAVSNSNLDDVLHDAQQLFRAAERIVKESCGEGWLLQPFIPDMERNEYRVYLVGGAEATGGVNDTAVVYTPAFHEYNDQGERRVYVWNVTLPLHFFSRAPVNPDEVLRPWLSSFKSLVANIDFNSSHVDEYQVSYFPYPIWRDAGMHDLIVRVALSAANAVAQSGRCMRMGQHVMLRVDVALTRQGDMAKPFINEAHVFNDAGLSFDVWPPRTGSPASDAPPKPTAITSADSSLHPSDPRVSSGDSTTPSEEHICLVDADTAAEKASCPIGDDAVAFEGAASSSNGSSVGVAAASDVVGSDVGVSRGYLLALKLWEEAIATMNA